MAIQAFLNQAGELVGLEGLPSQTSYSHVTAEVVQPQASVDQDHKLDVMDGIIIGGIGLAAFAFIGIAKAYEYSVIRHNNQTPEPLEVVSND